MATIYFRVLLYMTPLWSQDCERFAGFSQSSGVREAFLKALSHCAHVFLHCVNTVRQNLACHTLGLIKASSKIPLK